MEKGSNTCHPHSLTFTDQDTKRPGKKSHRARPGGWEVAPGAGGRAMVLEAQQQHLQAECAASVLGLCTSLAPHAPPPTGPQFPLQYTQELGRTLLLLPRESGLPSHPNPLPRENKTKQGTELEGRGAKPVGSGTPSREAQIIRRRPDANLLWLYPRLHRDGYHK